MLLPEGDAKDFLGREFLTWLWFHGEGNNWHLAFSDGDYIDYGLDELLVMEGSEQICRQRLSGPVPVKSPEAQVALLEGKKISTTRIVIVHQEREWTVTINGDTFNLSSLKLVGPTTSDIEERFAELSEDLEQLVDLFDKMYQEFLIVRLGKDWDSSVLPEIKEWVIQKQTAEKS